MATGYISPIYRPNTWVGDFDVPQGYNVVLHELFLEDANAILFIEQDASIWFV